MTTKEQLLDNVLATVAELEQHPAYTTHEYVCQECGEEWTTAWAEEQAVAVADECVECGAATAPWDTTEGPEYESASDWLEGQLGIEEWHLDGRGNYQSAEVLVASDGPDIRVDTCREVVIGQWGRDTIERSYTDVIGLDDWLKEICPVGGVA